MTTLPTSGTHLPDFLDMVINFFGPQTRQEIEGRMTIEHTTDVDAAEYILDDILMNNSEMWALLDGFEGVVLCPPLDPHLSQLHFDF